jgi:general secretion pathway protein J
MMRASSAGFTLIEVLIALAITALVATVAYSGLSGVISGAESTRAAADRSYEINRAWMIISRDMRQFVNRPVRDEFGDVESALSGGRAARFLLSLTRGGWHNTAGHPRSTLERVNYVLEDDGLWRESYVVLDRAGNTEARRVLLLSGVEELRLYFLDDLASLNVGSDGNSIDTRRWPENWVADTSQPGTVLAPPVAVELVMQLEDWGEMRRLYALPPL